MSELLTTKQLAERWDMSQGTLSNKRSKGQGPAYIKLGEGRTSKVRYRLEDIKQYERDCMKGTS